jgi:predicted nucleotidyltransferase
LLKEIFKKIKGVEVTFIYGSFAKKEEDIRSDIDLFIIGRIDDSKLIRGIRRLEDILKREINYSLFTRDEFKKKIKEKDSFIMDILENPKIFIVGDKSDL